ncbi:hypothetical protein [Lactobacillus johnsonii]|uniref:hypothetical protein n=1 Tax=Lactobacillus johnsonii TaxID=33959 RepID=UPI0014340DFA|nr:hypothetical protein [Lactobacillus johnsonii]GFI19456.1 hypothetical protein IMSAGC010_00003 [Lactobacillus johnsonii]
MRDKFYKVDDGTTLWSDDHQYYYDNDCYPNVRLIRKGNYLRDKDNKKVYEIVGDQFIYLREDNFKVVGGNAYIWYK